jgi:hypothetical protein
MPWRFPARWRSPAPRITNSPDPRWEPEGRGIGPERLSFDNSLAKRWNPRAAGLALKGCTLIILSQVEAPVKHFFRPAPALTGSGPAPCPRCIRTLLARSERPGKGPGAAARVVARAGPRTAAWPARESGLRSRGVTGPGRSRSREEQDPARSGPGADAGRPVTAPRHALRGRARRPAGPDSAYASGEPCSAELISWRKQQRPGDLHDSPGRGPLTTIAVASSARRTPPSSGLRPKRAAVGRGASALRSWLYR